MKAIIAFALFVAVSALPPRPIQVPEIPEPRVLLRHWEPQPAAPPQINAHGILEGILSQLANSPNADEPNSVEERITVQDIIDALNTIHEIIQNHHNHDKPTTPENGDEPEDPESASEEPQEEDEDPESASEEPQDEGEEPESASEDPQDEGEDPASASEEPESEDEETQSEGEESESASEEPQNENEANSENAVSNEPEPPASESASGEENESQENESASDDQSELADVEVAQRSAPIQSIDGSNLAIQSPADVIQQGDGERFVQIVQPYLHKPLRIPQHYLPEDIRFNIPAFSQ